MSASLFFQLAICAVTFALYLFGFEAGFVIDMSLFVKIAGFLTIAAMTFVYCYFSEGATHDLAAIGGIFYDCAWYRLPLKQQMLLIVSIQRAQKSYRMNGLGLVECSLRTFASV